MKKIETCNYKTFKTTNLFHFCKEGYLFQITILKFDINGGHLQMLIDVNLNVTTLEPNGFPSGNQSGP